MYCKSCLKRYNKYNAIPKELPNCGHILCSECLDYYYVNNKIICFMCNEVNYANTITEFPNNLSIFDESFTKMISFDNKDSENIIDFNITQNIEDNNFESIITSNNIKCNNHNKIIDAYCNTCNQMVCINCLTLNKKEKSVHKNHEILSMSTAFEQNKIYYLKNYKKIMLIKEKYDNILTQNKINEEKLLSQKYDCNKKIDEAINEIIERINFEAINKKTEIEENYNNKKEEIIKINNKIKANIEYIDSLIESITKSNPLTFLNNSNKLINQINNILNITDNKLFTNNDNICNINIRKTFEELSVNSEINYIISKINDFFNINKDILSSNKNKQTSIKTKKSNNKIENNFYSNLITNKDKNNNYTKGDNIYLNKFKNKNKKSKWQKESGNNNTLKNKSNKNNCVKNKLNFNIELLKNEKFTINSDSNSIFKQSITNSNNKKISNFALSYKKNNIINDNSSNFSFFSVNKDICSNFDKNKFVKSKNLKERTITNNLNVKQMTYILIFGGIKNESMEIVNLNTKKTYILSKKINFNSMSIFNYDNKLFILSGYFVI